ncbi:heme iron utilization protein [Candidatus Arthromitus sp. SFB-mouse-Japan]|uniref:HugZ family pyridoxamine 5'-phosphate oxidase n=1 Tax=unclassified Candidatus Neoarthromitus TaxID=2638829 RepID=UPI00021B7D89|nr:MULTISPECIES: pyridoxamine 5'-phosphate oxidase family protein [unclassified Candidatus Arthromitus]EIA23410.1 Putative heme iron utilization protein [Candidatus Arthromitus sp. SFB-2]EIA24521.1 Putative heme iron utilization protein [Candidatus Arthromitus sp. SFB-1]EIA26319.1 Putative heme iron utilization protein [Candidatus Arthromitus sp. SFB-4]EIA28763.1 Putative heme iron utilization protein [Candidatus Arthromitus sp. SFB-co]EIA31025.1 Putative heme iron utilization protein [Candida
MKEILNSQKTIMISSINGDGFPQISYSPYVMVDNKIYIYISRIADHHSNIQKNGNVSLMVISDESKSQNLFARERVSFKGNAKKLDEISDCIKEKFEEIHGKRMMEVLYGMDFDFFEIDILSGRLVKGFGKAFDLTYENNTWVEKQVVVDKNVPAHNK